MATWPLLLTALLLIGTIGTFPDSVDAGSPVLHRVGGNKFAWKVGVNFSNWTSQEKFVVGDWLYFGFNKSIYSVLEVNRTGYDNCIETEFITNITRGGRDVFNLTDPKPYFFISGHGFCSQGVKVAVNVLVGNDSPSNSSASIKNHPVMILLIPLLFFILHIYHVI